MMRNIIIYIVKIFMMMWWRMIFGLIMMFRRVRSSIPIILGMIRMMMMMIIRLPMIGRILMMIIFSSRFMISWRMVMGWRFIMMMMMVVGSMGRIIILHMVISWMISSSLFGRSSLIRRPFIRDDNRTK